MSGLSKRYRALVNSGELRRDPDQESAVRALAKTQQELERGKQPGILAKMFGRASPPVRGLYMWGGVGRGKSMLMDLFVETLAIGAKRRVHFHAFMLEVDAMLREQRTLETAHPVAAVAARIAHSVRCLAFDEMAVTNTADAAILGRLFTALIREEQVTIVTTSNRPPADLYKDGLNRSLFLPFIDLIEAELDVLPLNGPTDYRLERLGDIDTWHTPLGDVATQQVREAFFRLTDFEPEDAAHVPSGELDLGGGRKLFVPKSLKGVAVFSYRRLCGENRGSSDYLAIARNYHSVIVVGIPRMGPDNRNEAIRFTKLIDALYENRVKLFATAETEPERLYVSGDGSFEFARTVSRLKEMESNQYLALGHGASG